MLADRSTDREMRETGGRGPEDGQGQDRRTRATDRDHAASQGCRRTSAAPSSRSAPALADRRRRCSPAICSECTSGMHRREAGRWRCCRRAEGEAGGYRGNHRHRDGQGRVRTIEVRIRRAPRATRTRNENRGDAFIPPRQPLRCCLKLRTSTSRSSLMTSGSTPCARQAPADSMSTRRIRLCASLICPLGWS